VGKKIATEILKSVLIQECPLSCFLIRYHTSILYKISTQNVCILVVYTDSSFPKGIEISWNC